MVRDDYISDDGEAPLRAGVTQVATVAKRDKVPADNKVPVHVCTWFGRPTRCSPDGLGRGVSHH
jgi:hypothetical protein